MKRLEVSGAVRPLGVVRRQRVNVNILGSQCTHSTNDLVCYVALKMTN